MTLLAAGVLGIVVIGAMTLGPRPVETAVHQRDEAFARPFDYTVPPGTNIELDPKSDSLHVFWTRNGDMAEGMSIWLVTDVLADQCLPVGGVTPLQPGPTASTGPPPRGRRARDCEGNGCHDRRPPRDATGPDGRRRPRGLPV